MFRTAAGDVRACLEALREADRLLDAAPRTERAEVMLALANRNDGTMLGGVVGAAIAAASDVGGPATPGAAREFAEGIALLRAAAAHLASHSAAGQLNQAIAIWEHRGIESASNALGALVRQVYPSLREEFGLLDAPPLTDWARNDAEDDAAMRAAGLSRGRRALRIALVVTLVLGVYSLIFSMLG